MKIFTIIWPANKTDDNNRGNKKSAVKNNEKKYGELLGLVGKVTLADIHKAYKNKIKEYHPDKIEMMAGELKELAEQRTKELNKAYDYFKKKYS